MHSVQKYEPAMEKIMRMHSVTSTIEIGFVHLPEKAEWLARRIFARNGDDFRKGRFDDQSGFNFPGSGLVQE